MVEEKEKEEIEISKIRIPKQPEVLGIAEALLGADKVRTICEDNHTRICRIPGKLRKRMWISVGDVVLVSPWKVQSNERGDIIFRYTKTQANWLKKKGYGKNIEIVD